MSKEYSKKERELNALASFIYVWEMGAEGLHEIRVWNRVLSDAEIQASYNADRSSMQFAFPLTPSHISLMLQ